MLFLFGCEAQLSFFEMRYIRAVIISSIIIDWSLFLT